jgi:hypothetical protein
MSRYYFLICSLPQLTWGEKTDFTFLELYRYIEWNLTEADLKKVEKLRLYFDIRNMISFWEHRSIDIRGNLNEKLLEEALLTNTFFPSYVSEFFRKFTDRNDQKKNSVYLYENYFDSLQKETGFLSWYGNFEKKIRLTLTHLRAERLRKDIANELEFANKEDWDVRAILSSSQRDPSITFREYNDIKNIYKKFELEPLKLYQEIAQYRFNKIQEVEFLYNFTIDRVLAYLVRLSLIYDFMELDEKKAQTKLQSLA